MGGCSEKRKSVEGFYSNIINAPNPTQTDITIQKGDSLTEQANYMVSHGPEVQDVLKQMSATSERINELHQKQIQLNQSRTQETLEQNETMVYDTYPNQVIPGNETPSYQIVQGNTSGIENCKKICSTNPNCGGFSHWDGDNTCWMKDTSILPTPPVQQYTKSIKGDIRAGNVNLGSNPGIDKVWDEQSCKKAGGGVYGYCPETGIHYCGGVCNGVSQCPSNGFDLDACGKTVSNTPMTQGLNRDGRPTESGYESNSSPFMDTSEYCGGGKIYVNANTTQTSVTKTNEESCRNYCGTNEKCDMYLMSDPNTCHNYTNTSNISGYCQSGSGHQSWGGIKQNLASQVIKEPSTEGFIGGNESTKEGFAILIPALVEAIADAIKYAEEIDPRCKIRIVGNCGDYPNMTDQNWFDDQDQGGPTPTTSEACDSRKSAWEGTCKAGGNGITRVYNYYTGRGDNSDPPSSMVQGTHTWTTYVKRAEKIVESFQNNDTSSLTSEDQTYLKEGLEKAKNMQEGFETNGGLTSEIPYVSVGMWEDGSGSNRRLPDKGQAIGPWSGPTSGNKNMPEICSNHCQGYRYFGVQYGNQCWCGNDWDQATSLGERTSKDCSLTNGGPSCNSIYKNRVLTSQEIQSEISQNQQQINNELDKYESGIQRLQQYNVNLNNQTKAETAVMANAVKDYNKYIAIVKQYRDNEDWRNNTRITAVTDIARKSNAYIYMLWLSLVVILFILLIRYMR